MTHAHVLQLMLDVPGLVVSYPCPRHVRQPLLLMLLLETQSNTPLLFLQPVLLDMLRRAGFEIEIATFMGIGAAPGQSAVKQFLKALPSCRWLQSHQIFGMSHYIVARQPA